MLKSKLRGGYMEFIKKHHARISGALLIFSGLLLLGALYFFAPVCSNKVLLFNKMGDEILKPMVCAQTSQTAEILAYILIALGIDALFHAKIRISAIAVGVILFLIPSHHDSMPCAIGVCRMPMQCHTTAIWIKTVGALSVFAGCLNLFIRD